MNIPKDESDLIEIFFMDENYDLVKLIVKKDTVQYVEIEDLGIKGNQYDGKYLCYSTYEEAKEESIRALKNMMKYKQHKLKKIEEGYVMIEKKSEVFGTNVLKEVQYDH